MTEKQTGNARSVFCIMDERSLHCSILRGGVYALFQNSILNNCEILL